MELSSFISRVSSKLTGNSSEGEKFLVLKIASKVVVATTWQLQDGKVEIGQIGKASVASDDFPDWLEAMDKAVSSVFGQSEQKIIKVIFGVPPDWVRDGKIIENQLVFLRKICKELDLNPMGFVLVTEALENYFKQAEGAPLTAILVGIDHLKGWVTLFRAGKNLGTSEVVLDESLEAEAVCLELEKALKNFNQVEVLPARMIIHDGERNLRILEEKLTAFPWTKNLPFLHFPKVEILPAEFIVKALAFAGGAQMGGGMVFAKQDEEVSGFEAETVKKEQAVPSETGSAEVISQDEPPDEISNAVVELEEIDAAQAGFSTDHGVSTISIPKRSGNFGSLEELKPKDGERLVDNSRDLHESTPKKLFDFTFVKIFFAKLNNFRLKIGENSSKSFVIVTAFFVALIFGILAFVYFVSSATLVIHVNPKVIQKEMEISLAGRAIEATEIGTKKAAATGKKLVGDKAKGVVTIYGTAQAHTFPAGTVLTSSSGLKFTLDSSTDIASGSGAASQVTTTSTLTAFDIGDKYNLPAGNLFTLGSFPSSSYQAKNESDFSKGSSHEATVVTKSDQDRLLATLSAELSAKAKSDLEAKLEPGQSLLPNAITQAISKRKFSKEIDTEGDTVSLDLSMDFKGVMVSKEELLAQFAQKYPEEIPSWYSLEQTGAGVEIKTAKIDKNSVATILVNITVRAVPILDKQKIVTTVSGLNSKQTMEYVKGLPGVSRLDIIAKPKIMEAIIFAILPKRKGNISVEIVND